MKLYYTTITEPSTYEIPKIKGSRFFGTLFPVETREEAEYHLEAMRKKFPTATHHCCAYRIGLHIHQDLFGTTLIDPRWTKANDDGEPTNTAGKPILSVLEGHQLQNVLLVVTRYFGGILLGIGGLIQAYTQTAQEMITHTTLVQKEIIDEFLLTFMYNQTSLVTHLIEKYGAKVVEASYDEQVTQKFHINRGVSSAFKQELLEQSNGILAL